jgi:protein SCO1/2
MNKSVVMTVVVLVAVMVGLVGTQFYRYSHPSIEPLSPEVLSQYGAVLYQAPRAIPEVALITQDDQPFDFSALQGQWSLLNFGFTQCADICPVNMVQINQTQQRLLDLQMPSIGKFLVTLDPERDTTAVLKAYIQGFGAHWTAMRVEEPGLTAFAQSLNTVFFIDKSIGHGDHGYTVDHSDNLVLINPDGKMVGIFRPPHTPVAMAAVISNLMKTQP